ncbi:MAG: Rne/Rng family ribonuclease [Kiritimatiellae bacterium]|nr:Rne/Rng family ribonuclease [Kiritimatiellia bacterium]
MGLFKRDKVKREIIVNVERLETRVAVVEDGRLEEYMVEHPEEERLVGSIFKGRIQNLEDDLQAAFVDIGLKKNAFLHYWDMTPDCDAFLDEDEDDSSKNPKKKRHVLKLTNEEIHKRFAPGTEIIVQVTKGPISTKGPRVTANLSIPGRYLVMMPGTQTRGVSRKIGDSHERKRLKNILDKLLLPEDVGVIVRTAGMGATPRAFVRDLRNLLESWKELQGNVKNLRTPCCVYQEPGLVERVIRDWLTEDFETVLIDNEKSYEEMRDIAAKISRRAKNKVRRYDGWANIFSHFGLDRQLDEAFRRKVSLKSGGYLVIDETEALISVDVNTGHHKGNGSQEEAILNVNIEAVEEVARQLRLRNIGGLVVLDLIDMKSRKNQNQVYNALKAKLRRDHARTNVLKISELGLLEMSRQRQEESILSMLSSNCPCCNGRGIVKSPLAVSIELQRELHAILRKAALDKRKVLLKIIVSPAVMQRLRTEDSRILSEIQNKYGTRLTFVSELNRHPESFSILDSETNHIYYTTGGRSVVQGKVS